MDAASEPVLEQLPLGATVVLIRLRSLGDIVLTTPALELLHKARPDLWVCVAVDREFGAILDKHPAIDRVLNIDRDNKRRAIKRIRRMRPELCWNLHGGTTSALFTLLSGARFRVGYKHFGNRLVYNVRIPRAQEILGLESKAPVHTAEHHASGAFFLGAEQSEIPPSRLREVEVPEGERYAVLHVAASHPSKRWPTSRFLEVARSVAEKHGLRIRVIAGPGQDDLLAEFSEFETLPGLDVAKLRDLLAGASLFVGNDSGPAHVAAAYQVPCVVLFGNSDPQIWGPWRTAHSVLQSASIDSIEAEQVSSAVTQLVNEPELIEFPSDVFEP